MLDHLPLNLQAHLQRKKTRRANSLIRTLLVASSTLAILLVCFSWYQYSQMSKPTPAPLASLPAAEPIPSHRGPRLPTSPEQVSPQLLDEPPAKQPAPNATTSGAAAPISAGAIGQAPLGAGQNITVTIYPREGTKARIELAVSDWAPKDGSDHEFVLTSPEVRMRTRDGNDVRVVANHGTLEAQRKGGGALDPQRGRLRGNVVIEYDRRGEDEKAALPEELRGVIDPASIVRIEMDEVEFDLDKDKLWVPGPVKVTARDVEFAASDVEVMFDRTSGRVQTMRISRGGTLEILERPERLGVAMPGAQASGERTMNVVEWIRTSVEARMIESAKASATAVADQSKKPVEKELDGAKVPVFTKDSQSQGQSRPAAAIAYHARFEGGVDARQKVGEATQSRLQADVLEILRDFTSKDKERVKAAGAPPATGTMPTPAPEPSIQERIVLAWSGPMTLTTHELGAQDERSRARIFAMGAPARISFPDGQVECAKLVYEPDSGEVTMDGAESSPVIVRSAEQGGVTGQSVWMRQTEKDIEIKVTGPGTISGLAEKEPRVEKTSAPQPEGVIAFDGALAASGRRERRTSVDFTGGITTADARLLDRAQFTGRTRIGMDGTSLEADNIEVAFGPGRGWRKTQTVQRLKGQGNVIMNTEKDVVSCNALDVDFMSDADGRVRPSVATAMGDVKAQQGERVLCAKEKLIVDFERVADSSANTQGVNKGSSASKQQQTARLASTNSTRPAPGNKSAASGNDGVTAKRLRATGGVSIDDPSQNLELTADELDCGIEAGKEVTSALVVGSAACPANVRLDTFAVTGQRVSLDVPNQWAEIPGAGRMTFQSAKDLDGRKVREPVPISISWDNHMKFRGRENRAIFAGNVHAASQGTTTFDCAQLLVEFDDVPLAEVKKDTPEEGWITGAIARAWSDADSPSSPLKKGTFGKEVAAIHAAGGIIAQTAEMSVGTGELVSRARISGPKMSLNLRSEVSKMLIEGAGNLQLEDFRAARNSATVPENRKQGDLFGSVEDSGPSKTLIEWKDLMWYDFSIEQTRFEGHVRLKHLSGRQLEKVFGPTSLGTASVPAGRSTFLNCDVLAVDFQEKDRRLRENEARRMGRLSSERLRQFEAIGAVALQDQTEGLALTADRVTYERARKTLAISGTSHKKAHISTHQPGKIPNQVSVERLFYNLETGEMQLSKTSATGR